MKWLIAITLSLAVAPLAAQVKTTTPPKVSPAPKPIQAKVPAYSPELATSIHAADDNAFSRCLIPPEFVMTHQRELELTDAQRTKIVSEMSQAQSKFTEVQWGMSSEQQKLEELLAAAFLDPAASMKQLDKILTMENDVKRAQLSLLLTVKSTLTAKQLEELEKLRGPLRNQHLIVWKFGTADPPSKLSEFQGCGRTGAKP